MNDQPEALRVAQALEQQFPLGTAQHFLDGEAARLLREQHAEIERLRADAERWKDLATDAVSGLTYIKQHYGYFAGVGWDRVFAKKAAIDAAIAEERKP